MHRIVLLTVTAALTFTVEAADRVRYTYLGGDVTSSSSYDPAGTPGAGDQILIPADTDLAITYGTPGWTAIASLGESGHIVPLAATSRLVLDVPEATDAAEFPVPFTAWEYKSYFIDIDKCGALVKRGQGEVTLTAMRMTYNDYNTCFVVNTILVEKGALAFAHNNTKANIRLVSLDVKAGATVYLGARPSAACMTYCMGGFFGEGTITTKSAFNCCLQVFDNAAHPGVFNGKLTGNVYWQVTGGGKQSVMSTDNDYNVQFSLYWGTYGVSSLGNAGNPSSAGKHQYIWFTSAGAVLEYLGAGGERVDKQVVLGAPQGEPVTLSAGPNGGIEYKRLIYPGGQTTYPPHVRLGGSNAAEAAVSGSIEENKLGNSVYFSKVGSGAWRFKNSSGRSNCNGFAVREGRLIFDSIAETNAFCSLGVATNLFDGSSGPGWTADAHRTDIFLTLGSTNGQAAVFEWGGTNSQACSTRPVGLDGTGGHFRNDNPATQIRWRGARAIGGTPTLTLDGASTKTNEFADIADGVGADDAKIALGVCKDGAGTWKISGDTTFTGPLEVKAGKLIVAAPTTNLYSWFRWTLRGHKPDATGSSYQIEEFGLFGADNRRVNDGLEVMRLSANGWGEMGLNEMALQWPGGVVYGTQANMGPFHDGIESELGLVDHAKKYGFNIGLRNFGEYVFPQPDVPTTRLPVLFRLDPATAGEVKSWDYINLWAAGNAASAWSTLLEGSVDGLHWEFLDENTELDEAALGTKSWMWSFKKEVMSWGDGEYLHNTHTGGRSIRSHSTRTYSVLSGNPVVSVAAGAELVAEGPVSVANLKVDANGAGTIRGVTLADAGTLDVVNWPSSSQDLELPLVLEDCAGEVGEWAVSVGGVTKPSYWLTQRNGRISVHRSGTMLILR